MQSPSTPTTLNSTCCHQNSRTAAPSSCSRSAWTSSSSRSSSRSKMNLNKLVSPTHSISSNSAASRVVPFSRSVSPCWRVCHRYQCCAAQFVASSCCQARQRCQQLLRAVPDWDALGGANPQNVDEPRVLPHPNLTPLQAVQAQLDALKANDEPWSNHGIQTAYEWGWDVGGMDRSYYFGPNKGADLYHFDHFLGRFGVQRGALIGLSRYEVVEVSDQGGSDGDSTAHDTAGKYSSNSAPSGSGTDTGNSTTVNVNSSGSDIHLGSSKPEEVPPVVRIRVWSAVGEDAGVFTFVMARRLFGHRKGAWMTRHLIQG